MSHCYTEAKQRFANYRWISDQTTAPILNDVALENLNNANEGVLRDAIEYLTAYGRPEDRAPIVQHFMEWRPDWKNYPNYFHKPVDGPPADPGTSLLEKNWGVRSLPTKAGWQTRPSSTG